MAGEKTLVEAHDGARRYVGRLTVRETRLMGNLVFGLEVENYRNGKKVSQKVGKRSENRFVFPPVVMGPDKFYSLEFTEEGLEVSYSDRVDIHGSREVAVLPRDRFPY